MAVFLLLGTGLGLCFHYVIAGHYAGAAWPLSGLGERPDLVVNDYVLPLGISSELAPFDNIRAYRPFEPVPYGPFGLLVYAGLAQLPMALGDGSVSGRLPVVVFLSRRPEPRRAWSGPSAF